MIAAVLAARAGWSDGSRRDLVGVGLGLRLSVLAVRAVKAGAAAREVVVGAAACGVNGGAGPAWLVRARAAVALVSSLSASGAFPPTCSGVPVLLPPRSVVLSSGGRVPSLGCGFLGLPQVCASASGCEGAPVPC